MKKIFAIGFFCTHSFFSIAQNVGIGITMPRAPFNVADTKTVLFGSDTNGAGSKLIWYPSKSAFRAGSTNGATWDFNNIGTYSFASGYNTTASGDYSTAKGNLSVASGIASTALGNYSIASGHSSTAIGAQNTASGAFSTAIGLLDTASGSFSTAIGDGSVASGQTSMALGRYTTAKSGSEITIGAFNTDYSPLDIYNMNAADRLFTVGNGTSLTSKSDAMVILKNGSTGIGISTPGFPLNFAGTNGDKISLWGNTAGTGHYGFGVQPGLLQIHANTLYDDVAFGYGSSNNFTERMRVKGDGRVGIGTSDPYTTLHVKSTGSNPLIVEGGNNLFITLTESGTNVGYIGSYAGNPTDVELGTYSGNTSGSVILSTSNTPKLTVINNGNVGIGLSNPVYKLHLGNSNNGLRIEGPATLASGGSAISIGGTGDVVVDANNIVGGRLIVKENGNTGIGTSTPASKLEVDGALATKVKVYNTNTGNVNLDNTATVWIFTASGFGATFPAPSTCLSRRYTIVNRTSGTLITSSYWSIGGLFTSNMSPGSSMEIISTGSTWDQIK